MRLYDGHFKRLLAYMTRRVCDAELALDLTAESFAQAYAGRRRFRGSTDDEAAAWLFGIASRLLARYFRGSFAQKRAYQRLGLSVPHLDDERRERIEELADLDGLRSALRVELQGLSPAQRNALLLRVVEELPYPEVARRLRITEPAARARVARGLKALSAAIDGNPSLKEQLT